MWDAKTKVKVKDDKAFSTVTRNFEDKFLLIEKIIQFFLQKRLSVAIADQKNFCIKIWGLRFIWMGFFFYYFYDEIIN